MANKKQISGDNRKICLGVFVGAHGVQGLAKIKTFTGDPGAIAAYGPVATADGARRFTLSVRQILKNGVVLVSAPEIESREDALALSKTKLFVDRDALPAPDDADEFYLEDLVGLSVEEENGENAGEIAAVHNFGAGDLLEVAHIPNVAGSRLVPFTRQAIPTVDIPAGKVVVAEAFSPQRPENDGPEPADGAARARQRP